MRVRPAQPSDASAVDALIADVEAADGQAPLSEHKHTALRSQRSRSGAAFGFVAEGDSEIRGYAALVRTNAPREWGLELVVRPADRSPDVIAGLVERAATEVAGRDGGKIRLWAYVDDLVPRPERYGFAPERRLHRMSRSLPTEAGLQFPEGVEVRGFVPGRDDDAWLAVNNAAFADHPENGDWTSEDLEERMELAWFDPEGFRVAWDGDELVGFCWTKVHPHRRGEIYVIAVAPGHGGRGLGTALVVEGMRFLSAAGMERVFLYCEASNDPAVGLYRSLGFEVERTHRASVREV